MTLLVIDWAAAGRVHDASRALKSGETPSLDLSVLRELETQDLDDLAAIATAARASGRKPALVTASQQVRLLLSVTRLDQAFIIDGPDLLRRAHSRPQPQPRRAKFGLVLRTLLAILTAGTLAACANSHDLRIEPASASYMPEKPETIARQNRKCPAAGTALGLVASGSGDGFLHETEEPRHGAGDEVKIDIADGEDFSGSYTINLDGRIELPHAGPVMASGLTNAELGKAIARQLVAAGLFLPGHVRVSVATVKWAPMQVHVAGAVFQPGRAVINEVDRDKLDPDTAVSAGDAPTSRYLDAGLRGGAGVRPDADLSRIEITRGGRTFTVDMSGVITGDFVPQIPLMAGDRIHVPSTGCFQSALMRPSQVTPAGIRVFMSNLTQPAASNNASAVERYATNVPFGTRLLQGAISSNCAGGAVSTNASRSVVLVSVNPFTGKTEVIERSIEDLISSPDRDEVNPYLMPNDGIACYDSGVTNMREAARAIVDILAPVGILVGLL